MSLYEKKKISVNGYYRFDPRLGHKIYVPGYFRKQRFRKPGSYPPHIIKKYGQPSGQPKTYLGLINEQKKKEEWANLSENYPNIMGLTDQQIEEFIKKKPDYEQTHAKEYIKHIYCIGNEEFYDWSKRAMGKMEQKIFNTNDFTGWGTGDAYSRGSTIFITSPRGGFYCMTDFAYANHLSKDNFPYDWDKSGGNLQTYAMPYHDKIYDVNDIVYLDDIYMSGEQCEKALGNIGRKLDELNIPISEMPRIHYMAIAGNLEESRGKNEEYIIHNPINKVSSTQEAFKVRWFSHNIGKKFRFKTSGWGDKHVSALVYPFSIPDGGRHRMARQLYGTFAHKRFEHLSGSGI